MIRIFLAAAVWVVVVGGTSLYLRMHEARAASLAPVLKERVVAGYRLELTPTFAAAPDPFALQLDASAARPALVVKLNGEEILRRTDAVTAGEVIVIETLPPVRTGENEIFVEAAPPGDAALQSHALRVRVARGAQTVADDTLWTEPGASLSAGVRFQVTDAAVAQGDAHEH
jgi:hypothetical protein